MAAQQTNLPLVEREIGWFDPTRLDRSPGRRLRVFAALVRPLDGNINAITRQGSRTAFITARRRMTYGEVLRSLESGQQLRVSLRVGESPQLVTSIPDNYQRTPRDPDLHPALQDLADEINEDIREALSALDDPHAYFAGVDEGIEPVSDDHVKLVIWAMQRELDRELRPAPGQAGMLSSLPAAPLWDLPWSVQRALAERRRLRFVEYGITRDNWQSGLWSLWNVPSDPTYVPRRSLRLEV